MKGKNFSGVCGNTELTEHIKSEIRSGNVSHAYIINGLDNEGKFEFAFSFAEALLCEGKSEFLPCGECFACKKADVGSHPDIKIIDKGSKAGIGVDIIRELRSDAFIIPSEAEKKVYIIKDAETMTVQAQNAFLLTLEEPPAYVTYLLLCRDTSALLETIRSRAPSFTLCPASNTELEAFLIDRSAEAKKLKNSDPESWQELLTIADGNAGYARELLTGKALAERIADKKEALDLIKKLLSGSDDVYLTVSSLKKTKREAVILLLSDMVYALRDMLISKKTSEYDTCFFVSCDRAREESAPYSAKKLSLSSEAIFETMDRIEANAQILSALLFMAVKIREIK